MGTLISVTAIEVTNEWERYDLVGTASGGTTTCIIGISDSVSGTGGNG